MIRSGFNKKRAMTLSLKPKTNAVKTTTTAANVTRITRLVLRLRKNANGTAGFSQDRFVLGEFTQQGAGSVYHLF